MNQNVTQQVPRMSQTHKLRFRQNIYTQKQAVILLCLLHKKTRKPVQGVYMVNLQISHVPIPVRQPVLELGTNYKRFPLK